MKNRLISFLLIFLLSATYAFAQSTDKSNTSFAILGGINVQNLNGKAMNGDKLENDIILGYHAGVNIQIPIVPEFFFQPGVLFSTKGAKNTSGLFNSTYKLSYIEMPLNFVYKSILGNGYFQLGFGPYIAYAIGGKVLTEAGDISLESDIDFRNVVELSDPLLTSYFKPFDAGANIFVGYEMANGIFLQMNTQLGLLKINPEDQRVANDKSAVNNTGFSVSIGYRF